VRDDGLSIEQCPLTRFALDDASHRQEQIDLSPASVPINQNRGSRSKDGLKLHNALAFARASAVL